MAADQARGRAAAFLDRDGTLNFDPGYLGEAAALRLLPGAAAAVARLQAAGYTVVVVTNQSGVGRGYFPEESVLATNQRLAELLLREDPAARIDAFYYCPHAPAPGDAPGCACRKPAPGMLLQAARELALDLSTSLTIGDSERDVEAGRAAGCRRCLRISPQGDHRSLADAVAAALSE